MHVRIYLGTDTCLTVLHGTCVVGKTSYRAMMSYVSMKFALDGFYSSLRELYEHDPNNDIKVTYNIIGPVGKLRARYFDKLSSCVTLFARVVAFNNLSVVIVRSEKGIGTEAVTPALVLKYLIGWPRSIEPVVLDHFVAVLASMS